jgi:transposase-like protein
MIGTTWREAWEHVIPFLAFPTDVRRVIYTANTIEALHRQIRKTIKTRGHFPTEEAARRASQVRDRRQSDCGSRVARAARARRLRFGSA